MLKDASKTPVFRPEALSDGSIPGVADITPGVPGKQEGSDLEGIATVYDTRASGLTLWHDIVANESVRGIDRD